MVPGIEKNWTLKISAYTHNFSQMFRNVSQGGGDTEVWTPYKYMCKGQ